VKPVESKKLSSSIPRHSFRPSMAARSKLLQKGRRSLLKATHPMLFFYIKEGKIKLTVVSEIGKEATIGILNENAFLGEGCLQGRYSACALQPH
jgi:CRP/FNR family transcriptional regulator, cyclic AMP receptor protein